MAPSKSKSKGQRDRSSKKELPSTPKPKSTAAIFAEHAGNDDNDKSFMDDIIEQKKQELNQPQDEDSMAKNNAFPFNYIYELQDFINAHINFCKFIQVLVIGYLSQIFYLAYSDEFYIKASIIGFNLFGIVLGSVVTYRSQYSKWEDNPTNLIKPILPEFNLIYAVFIPIAFSLILDLKFFIVNLGLNYFVTENLHPIAKLGASIMYYEVYNENKSLPTPYFIAIAIFHLMITYSIDTINNGNYETETELSKEVIEQDDNINLNLVNHDNKLGNNVTLTKTEIHLFSVFLINLLFNFNSIELVDINLPIIIFQKLIISLLITLFTVYPVFKLYEKYNYKVLALIIVGLFVSLFYYLTNYQLEPILHNNSIEWLWNYINPNKPENELRFKILVTWISSLILLIPLIYGFSDKITLNSRRKIWHYILLISISYPALIVEPNFVCLSLLGSIILFLIIEIIRYNKFTFIGQWLFDKLKIFQDFKDLKGPLNLSYIFLILGVVLPIVYDLIIIQNGISIRSFIGIITLGVGDSFASIIGKKYGSIKWKSGNKSLQGSIAFITFTLIGFYIADQFLLESQQKVKNWENLFISCFLAALLEGSATLNDNFLIPCMFLTCYEVVNKQFP